MPPSKSPQQFEHLSRQQYMLCLPQTRSRDLFPLLLLLGKYAVMLVRLPFPKILAAESPSQMERVLSDQPDMHACHTKLDKYCWVAYTYSLRIRTNVGRGPVRSRLDVQPSLGTKTHDRGKIDVLRDVGRDCHPRWWKWRDEVS